jgi:hypothetical protein
VRFIHRIGLCVGLVLVWGVVRSLRTDAPYLTMAYVLLTAVVGVVPALIARSKGRSFEAWWAFGFFLPPIALLTAMLVDRGVVRSRKLTILGVLLFGGQMLVLFTMVMFFFAL